MPRRGKKNTTKIDKDAENASTDDAIENLEKISIKTKEKNKLEDKSEEVEYMVRPLRKSRDLRNFDRADYIKTRDTPMVTSSKRKEIQDILNDDSSVSDLSVVDDKEYSDEDVNDFSDPADDNVDLYNIIDKSNLRNNNMTLLTVILMANSLSESAKLESTRMKNISNKADKLSEIAMSMLKKSDN